MAVMRAMKKPAGAYAPQAKAAMKAMKAVKKATTACPKAKARAKTHRAVQTQTDISGGCPMTPLSSVLRPFSPGPLAPPFGMPSLVRPFLTGPPYGQCTCTTPIKREPTDGGAP